MTTDMAVVTPGTNLFQAEAPTDVLPLAKKMADQLADLIKARKLYTIIGKDDKAKAYVHLEGWQAAGAIVGVTAIVTATKPLTDAEGALIGFQASAEARLIADATVVGAADSMCTKREKRGPWKNSEDHALLGMAQTRAMSRALKGPLGWIVVLAGYSPTPAEEMEITRVLDGNAEVTPEWGNDPKLAENLASAARTARLLDAVKWSPAKIRARLSGATDDDRNALLDELTAFNDAQQQEDK